MVGLNLSNTETSFPLRDCGVGEIIFQLCEPVTGAGGVTDCRTVAETHIAVGCEAFFNAFVHEAPRPREARFAIRKRQAIVVGQILEFRPLYPRKRLSLSTSVCPLIARSGTRA